MAAEPLRIGSAPPRSPSHCRAGAPGLTLTPGDRGPDCGQELRAPWPASVAPPPALAGRAPPPCRPPPEPGACCPWRLRLRCEVYADPDERTRPPWLQGRPDPAPHPQSEDVPLVPERERRALRLSRSRTGIPPGTRTQATAHEASLHPPAGSASCTQHFPRGDRWPRLRHTKAALRRARPRGKLTALPRG